MAFGTLHVALPLPNSPPRHPELKIDLSITDRWVNLAEEGYDVAIHVTGDPQPNLVARPLAPVRRKLCATPDYFRRKGIPANPDLVAQAHNCWTTRAPASRAAGASPARRAKSPLPVNPAARR